MRLLQVKIELINKKFGMDESESSLAVIDLDEVTCMYDAKDDGVMVCGRDVELYVKNYSLEELTLLKLGRKELPKLYGVNGDGTCEAEVGTEDSVCSRCGMEMSRDWQGNLKCDVCMDIGFRK